MANSRPVVSLYSNDRLAYRRENASRVAHATTADRAVSAAFRRILAGDYKYCVIFAGLGVEVFRIKTEPNGIKMVRVEAHGAHWIK